MRRHPCPAGNGFERRARRLLESGCRPPAASRASARVDTSRAHVPRSSTDRSAQRADTLLRDSGGRPTPARAAVLGTLLAASLPLSHREIEDRLHAQGVAMDRVTVYRALDWLLAHGLAHKLAGEDRTWRFTGAQVAHGSHPHFECRACGRLSCLEQVRAPSVERVPRGYRVEHAELRLRGLCPACSAG